MKNKEFVNTINHNSNTMSKKKGKTMSLAEFQKDSKMMRLDNFLPSKPLSEPTAHVTKKFQPKTEKKIIENPNETQKSKQKNLIKATIDKYDPKDASAFVYQEEEQEEDDEDDI